MKQDFDISSLILIDINVTVTLPRNCDVAATGKYTCNARGVIYESEWMLFYKVTKKYTFFQRVAMGRWPLFLSLKAQGNCT